MDVQIRDAAALRQVSSANLKAYLESDAWVRGENWRGRLCVWAKEHKGQTWQILAPLREHADDYPLRIAEAVATLSAVEQRSQLEVYYDLLAAGRQ